MLPRRIMDSANVYKVEHFGHTTYSVNPSTFRKRLRIVYSDFGSVFGISKRIWLRHIAAMKANRLLNNSRRASIALSESRWHKWNMLRKREIPSNKFEAVSLALSSMLKLSSDSDSETSHTSPSELDVHISLSSLLERSLGPLEPKLSFRANRPASENP